MGNTLGKVRRREYDAVKADAQTIYRAESLRQAEAAFSRLPPPVAKVSKIERRFSADSWNVVCGGCSSSCRMIFPGLLPITQSLFLNADVQLCVMHMQRNAKAHLNKPDAVKFQQRWRAIKSAWSLELAHQQFEELCDCLAKASDRFIAELRKKRPHYLAFLNYLESSAVPSPPPTSGLGVCREQLLQKHLI